MSDIWAFVAGLTQAEAAAIQLLASLMLVAVTWRYAVLVSRQVEVAQDTKEAMRLAARAEIVLDAYKRYQSDEMTAALTSLREWLNTSEKAISAYDKIHDSRNAAEVAKAFPLEDKDWHLARRVKYFYFNYL